MSRDNRKLLTRFIVSLFLLIGINMVWTSEAEVALASGAANGTGFTYKIQKPENQITPESGYFDLMMTPSQQQTLIVTLSNPSETPVTVNLNLNGAKTNRNGVIVYDNGEIENDASLPFIFTDIVTGPGSVELAAGETKDVELNIQMPETTFDGVLAGGLQLVAADKEDATESIQGTTVINKYAYVVAILLQEGDPSGLLPEMSWNRAYADQLNHRNTIFVNFSNIAPTFTRGMTVQAQISSQGSSEVLYESRSTSLQMAPNSFLDYPISMNGDQMEAGMYTAYVMVYVGEQSWEFTEDFEVTTDQAAQFNERDVGLTQERGIDWMLIAMIAGGFLVAVIVIFVIIRQVKKKKQNQAKRKKRSKKTVNAKQKQA